MKKKYNSPYASVILMSTADVISTSDASSRTLDLDNYQLGDVVEAQFHTIPQ